MSGRAIAYELLCEEILCFAILALGPGSRSARASALAPLARDTRISCPGRATPDLIRGSEEPGPRGHTMTGEVGDLLIIAICDSPAGAGDDGKHGRKQTA